MDVMKVYDTAKDAIEFVRKNSQPYYLKLTLSFSWTFHGRPRTLSQAGRSQEVAGE